MPLKDHKAELRAVSLVAGMLKHQAQQKTRASLNVGFAISALAAKKQFQEDMRHTEEVAGVSWGAW